MLTQIKTITTRIDIEIISNKDVEEQIMMRLRELFENRCDSSCKIIKILKINKRSMLTCSNDDPRYTYICNVNFDVEYIKYYDYQIIHNCQIDQILDSYMICTTQDAKIHLYNTEKLRSFSKGQIIPLIVAKSFYDIKDTTVSIFAFPFAPRHTFDDTMLHDQYYTLEAPSKSEIEEMHAYYAQFQQIEHEYQKLKTSRRQFFEKLLYPYKKTKSLPSKSKVIDFRNPASIKKCVVVLNSSIPLHEPKLITLEETDQITQDVHVFPFYQQLVDQYIATLHDIAELCHTYDSDAEFKRHANVWKVYEMHKL